MENKANHEVENSDQDINTEKETTENQSSAAESLNPEANKNADKSPESEGEDLNLKIKELNEKYLRLYSEFDNFRKRSMKERVELSKTASADVITSLLPVLDDLERCLSSTKENDETALKTGVSLIYSKFLNSLKQKGLEEIDVLGKVYDPELSEAITHIPVEDPDKKNTVIDVVEKGYYLNGKVIRFAKVVTGS